MACWTLEELNAHWGHKVNLAKFSRSGGDVVLMCETCNEVLLEFHMEPEEDNDGVCTGYDVLVLGPEPEDCVRRTRPGHCLGPSGHP